MRTSAPFEWWEGTDAAGKKRDIGATTLEPPLGSCYAYCGSEYCGNPERHEYELYLAVEDIDHLRTKSKGPQTNGICERFHKTALNEFYRSRSAKRWSFNRRAADRSRNMDPGTPAALKSNNNGRCRLWVGNEKH